MGLEFYKANKRVTGAGANVNFDSKGKALYISMVKQSAWNEQAGQGVFKDGAKVNCKFSVGEIGAIIDAIQTNRTFKAFHDGGDQITQIEFAPYMTGENKDVQAGYGLRIHKTDSQDSTKKESFQIGFNFGEGVALMEYLKFSLTHIFSAIYAADKKAYDDAQKKKSEAAAKPAGKAAEKAAPAKEEASAASGDDELPM